MNGTPGDLGTTIEVGSTGWDLKRPVLAGACDHGCPWGEIANYVRDAMVPLGYDVLIARNGNGLKGPGLVSRAGITPPLSEHDIVVGTTARFDAPVDFGVVDALFLWEAYHGVYMWEKDGGFPNLRLIARLDDPMYILAATPVGSGVESIEQLAAIERPLRVLTDGEPTSIALLESVGVRRDDVEAAGGAYLPLDFLQPLPAAPGDYDVVVGSIASPAQNPESRNWTVLTHRDELRFLDLPDATRAALVSDFGLFDVTAKWGLLNGMDRPIRTVAKNGTSIFAREDTPDADAYAVAKAISNARAELVWYIRPYSYDPNTAWINGDVPLHPGARRYYEEQGALR
ncbi:MAG TPA: TAXI family TRAP transporter solute-binding subunit [Microbacterium sp.]|nr:TAXI family TRAP transporter solute-binding subunit [Microbacterium sp.]